MDHAYERLSLDEVEALARDSLMRVGAAPQAAEATGWTVRMAERVGADAMGLSRLAQVLEAIRMGLINPGATPQPSSTSQGIIRVDVKGGLADGAVSAGLPAFLAQAERYGIGMMALIQCGDAPALPIWLQHIAEARLVAIGLSGADGGAALTCLPIAQDRTGPIEPLGNGAAISALLTALSGGSAHEPSPTEFLEERPSGAGSSVLIAARPAPAAFAAPRDLDALGLSPDAADRDVRRRNAETDGVVVPLALLERIIGA